MIDLTDWDTTNGDYNEVEWLKKGIDIRDIISWLKHGRKD